MKNQILIQKNGEWRIELGFKYLCFSCSHFVKVIFGLDKTVIATAHGLTAFEAKSKAADRAMIVLSKRISQIEVKIV